MSQSATSTHRFSISPSNVVSMPLQPFCSGSITLPVHPQLVSWLCTNQHTIEAPKYWGPSRYHTCPSSVDQCFNSTPQVPDPSLSHQQYPRSSSLLSYQAPEWQGDALLEFQCTELGFGSVRHWIVKVKRMEHTLRNISVYSPQDSIEMRLWCWRINVVELRHALGARKGLFEQY